MSLQPLHVPAIPQDNKPEQIADASDARILRAREGPQIYTPELRHLKFERDFLLSIGFSDATVAELELEAFGAGVSLIEFAIAAGILKAPEFYSSLSRTLALAIDAPGASRLIMPAAPAKAWRLLDRPVALPIEPRGAVALNAQAMPIELLTVLSSELGEKRSNIKLLTRQTLINSITFTFGSTLVKRAVSSLLKRRPELSAKSGLAAWQAYSAALTFGVLAGAAFFAPREVAVVTGLGLSLFFMIAVGLRFLAVASMLSGEREPPHPLLEDRDLPRYTVFVPLFREAEVLPYLAQALSDLDYPPAKLDIKIVLESIDAETIHMALRLPFPGNVDFIIVPDCQPRTKPKALNYALQFATGDLAVIYDAEDRPEPDQLRKAASVFHHAAPDVVCLQARLDYFNARENWLSRQFTIEYAALFRGILPFMSRHALPLPLGGTSNHFRMPALRQLGAWDPYNVTEDADLGVRLHRAGFCAQTLDSTTYEEACCQPLPWIRQRTRWLKGWMQTFGVHMRAPARTLRETGLSGFLAFQAYFAGIIISALAHPVFYVLIAIEAWNGRLLHANTPVETLLIGVAVLNFAGGYAANLLLGLLSLRHTRHRGLIPHLIFIPFYWLLISAAAYRALWQLLRAPFYWEKTTHGVSKHMSGPKRS